MRFSEPKVHDTTESRVYIGEKCVVHGDIFAAEVVINGSLEGNIQAARLHVGASGRIEGKVIATNAAIHGFVLANMEINQSLIIHASGHIEGIAAYGDLFVEKGAVIRAKLSIANIHAPMVTVRDHLQIERSSSHREATHEAKTTTPKTAENYMTKLPAADF
jgi:cytoskeletal protein CcmA (bactofilin family)